MRRLLILLLITTISLATIAQPPIIPYRKGDQWGYCNPQKKMLLAAQYDLTQPFNKKSLAVVVKNQRQGLVNRSIKVVLPTAYQAIAYLENSNYLKVQKNNYWALLSPEGKLLTDFRYREIERGYWDKYFLVVEVKKSKANYGLISSLGKVVIPARYQRITPCKIKGKYETPETRWFYVERQGKVGAFYLPQRKEMIPTKYQSVLLYHQSTGIFTLSKYQNKVTLYGACDSTHKIIVPFKYDKTEESRGQIVVSKNGKMGCYNKYGKLVIPITHDFVSYVGNDLYHVRNGDSTAVVDKNNQLVDLQIPPYPETIEVPDYGDDYYEQMKMPKISYKDGKIGFKLGEKMITPYKYDQANEFKKGLAKVWFNGKVGYIDANGVEYFED